MDVVTCPSCREENPARFRLCGFCGASLAPAETIVCPSCGEENPSRFRLCGFCGTALQGGSGGGAAAGAAAPGPAPSAAAGVELGASEVRKPATFIFVDLKGSTALTERIDQEAMSEIKKRYFSVMAAQIERHGGTIEKYIGDAIMAVFGIPRAHEDDALRAVRAAHDMQQELVRLNAEFLPFYGVELANRTGVNTGEVVANTDPNANQQLATGDTVNVAARLEQAAPANEILIGETTYDLVRAHVEVEEVEPLELKGKSEKVPAYRLVRVRDPGEVATEASSTLREAPLVGRAEELALLEGRLAETTARAACLAITVVGDPGVGKTRLVREFTMGHAADARVLRGRCLPYGDGVTFWPLAEITRDAAGIVEDDSPETAIRKIEGILASAGEDGPGIAERLAAAVGLSAASWPVTELFWGGRRLLETLARERPLLVVVDDLHWAQPTFLAFLEYLVTTATGAPMLLLGTARHALLETRPDWSARTDGPVLELAPLTAEDAAGLVDHLLGDTELDDVMRGQVVASADGNPLFVEQLVSMLVDKGLLQRVDGRWRPTRELADLTVPPTIQALLASRLDDLSREERAVVEPASVIGVTFFEPAVEEMVPGPVRPAVPEHLTTLDGKQFIARDPNDPDEETYRFRHGLIREATYSSLLKRTRAQLHERFVAWAERVNRERGREQEFEEILGYHLEQAYRYRTELGPLDELSRDLARRAAVKLSNAGRRAFVRGDMPAAASLLRRAASLLPEDDRARLEILPDLGEALMEHGEFDEAVAITDDGIAASERIGDARLAARARLARVAVDIFSGADASLDAAIDRASATIDVFRAAGDDAGLARAHRLLMVIQGTVGDYAAAATAAEAAVEHGTRAGDQRLAARGAAGYATVALHGSIPASEVRVRCEQLLEQVRGDRKAEAVITGVLAQVRAMTGDFDEARVLYARARDMLGDLGPSVTAASSSIERSRVEILAGDLAAAEADLRADDAALGAMGEQYFRSTVDALLALVLVEAGRFTEADGFATSAQGLADPDDTLSQVVWRLAQARILANDGRTAEGVAMAAVAVELAAGTGSLALLGDAHVSHGLTLAQDGQEDAARAAWSAALACYEQKGDVVSAARAAGLLTSLAAR